MHRSTTAYRIVRKKLALVGDANSGKTALVFTYNANRSGNCIEDVRVEGKCVDLEFWITPEYEPLRPFCYLGTNIINNVFILAFAIDDFISFRNVTEKWMPEVRSFNPDAPVLLVGCKVARSRVCPPPISCCVPTSEAEAMAATIGACGYYECLTYDQDSVETVFELAAKLSLASGE